ncbi:DUF29 domain-containing protein [Thiocystis violascens]|uniref:DUF29 domain-containing protein n=1 Tax=Thiocystis violascens (strain ATCC 17096 / DSM 198 / 6111) TaxID=765911 RepID=I3Y839_THIV6|nr:DUF29 domain-containing protein [Thiocystis violascens]AFL73157.1 protein of unknown function DUF29 [Thiocystis violascens DSM 198]
MATQTSIPASHDRDFYAWALESANRLRAGNLAGLDLQRIAEEIEGMGRAEKHALASHLKILILHLLKWRYQPTLRSLSWQLSIANARDEIAELLEDSPSLTGKLPEILARRYPAARQGAILETGLPAATFPTGCPLTVEQLLDPEYWT